MRQIKFKAKINHFNGRGEKDEWFGRWVVGLPEISLNKQPPFNVKMNPIEGYLYSYPVDPETICECTGASVQGKEVYEHDLLDLRGEVPYEVVRGKYGEWVLHPHEQNDDRFDISFHDRNLSGAVLVGNVYDDYEPPLYFGNNEAAMKSKELVEQTYKDVKYYSWQEEELLEEPER